MTKTAIIVGMTVEERIAKILGCEVILATTDPLKQISQMKEAIASGTKRFISFGVAGSLNHSVKAGDIIIATSVVSGSETFHADHQWTQEIKMILDAKGIAYRLGRMLGSPGILNMEAKLEYAERHSVDFVDMETFHMAKCAASHNIPFIIVRTISDGVETEIPPCAIVSLNPDGTISHWRLFRSLVINPSQIPSFVKLCQASFKAFRNLKKVAKTIKGKI